MYQKEARSPLSLQIRISGRYRDAIRPWRALGNFHYSAFEARHKKGMDCAAEVRFDQED